MPEIQIERLIKERNRAIVAAIFFLASSMTISIPRALRFRGELKSANEELISKQAELATTQQQLHDAQLQIGQVQAEIGRLLRSK